MYGLYAHAVEDDNEADDTLDEPAKPWSMPEPHSEVASIVEEVSPLPAPTEGYLALSEQVRVWRGTVTEHFAALEILIDTVIAQLVGVTVDPLLFRMRGTLFARIPI